MYEDYYSRIETIDNYIIVAGYQPRVSNSNGIIIPSEPLDLFDGNYDGTQKSQMTRRFGLVPTDEPIVVGGTNYKYKTCSFNDCDGYLCNIATREPIRDYYKKSYNANRIFVDSFSPERPYYWLNLNHVNYSTDSIRFFGSNEESRITDVWLTDYLKYIKETNIPPSLSWLENFKKVDVDSLKIHSYLAESYYVNWQYHNEVVIPLPPKGGYFDIPLTKIFPEWEYNILRKRHGIMDIYPNYSRICICDNLEDIYNIFGGN